MEYRFEKQFKHLFPEAEWEPSGGSNFLTNCPFHEHNESKTFAIDFETALWHCFNPSCGTKGKGIEPLRKQLKRALRIEQFENQLIQGKQELFQDEEALTFLTEERGLSIDTIKKYQLAVSNEIAKDQLTGVENPKKYILIPIFDDNGNLVAGKKYLLKNYRTKDEPKIKFAWSGSEVTLYPDMPNHKAVILVEGEWDALLLRQFGFPAVTTTGGQGGASFLRFLDQIEGKQVFICFDCDNAGREGAERVAQALLQRETNVRVIDLGLNDGEDVTDYFVKYRNSPNAFRELSKRAVVAEKHLPEEVPMSKIGAKHLNNQYLVKARIIGEAGINKFLWFSHSVLTCKGRDADVCEICPLRENNKTISINPDNPLVVEFMEQTPDKQRKLLADLAHIPFVTNTKRCNYWTLAKESKREIGVPVFIESLEEDTPDSKKEWAGYVTTEKAASQLKSGREAVFWLTPVQDTKTDGKFIFIANEVSPVQDDLDTFKMTDELHERLKVFQGSPSKKIPEISKSLNEHVFRFRGREDLITTYDLVYHSVLRFSNPNAPSRTVKGWVEALIVGDPGEGKSQLATDMVAYYGLGAYQDAATATPGGLTVTTVQMGGKWVFRDGLMPLNDRRLVFIDEFNKLDGEDLGRLNTSRSSGVITASSSAGTYEKDARARLAWITNPKNGQRINTGKDAGDFPIKMVSDLFTDRGSQDRLDFAVAVLREDEKPDFQTIPEYNQDPVYTKELCRKLILWAWTRKPENIFFQDEAIQEIRLVSNRLRRKFWHPNSDIELINSGERTTERIMRLSASVAARVYSTVDGQNLFVTKEHVQFVEKFLVEQYEKMEFDKYITSLNMRQKTKERKQLPQTSTENQVTEQAVLGLLSKDKWLFDSLETGKYDIFMEKDSQIRGVIKFLYAHSYVRSDDSRHFKFTKSFHEELEGKLFESVSEF